MLKIRLSHNKKKAWLLQELLFILYIYTKTISPIANKSTPSPMCRIIIIPLYLPVIALSSNECVLYLSPFQYEKYKSLLQNHPYSLFFLCAFARLVEAIYEKHRRACKTLQKHLQLLQKIAFCLSSGYFFYFL